jgi:hypothetical protein
MGTMVGDAGGVEGASGVAEDGDGAATVRVGGRAGAGTMVSLSSNAATVAVGGGGVVFRNGKTSSTKVTWREV